MKFYTTMLLVIFALAVPPAAAAKTDPGYYFRPQKTILVRTISDGGESYYFAGEHRATLPALWRLLR